MSGFRRYWRNSIINLILKSDVSEVARVWLILSTVGSCVTAISKKKSFDHFYLSLYPPKSRFTFIRLLRRINDGIWRYPERITSSKWNPWQIRQVQANPNHWMELLRIHVEITSHLVLMVNSIIQGKSKWSTTSYQIISLSLEVAISQGLFAS